MKRAIFLLALCAFQTVFADLKKDLENLRATTTMKIKSINDKLKSDIKVAVDDARYRSVGTDVLKCKQEYKNLEAYLDSDHCKNHYNNCYAELFKTYYKQKQTFKVEAFQYAQKCDNEHIVAFEQVEQECRARARKCIADQVEVTYGVGNGFVHERL